MAMAFAGICALAVAAEWNQLRGLGPWLGLLALLAWSAYWSPFVEVSDGGVVLHNPARTIRMPWPAIQSVSGKYGLRLETAYGRYDGWAAPVPVGRERLRGGESEAATLVRTRLQQLQAEGHLDRITVEFATAPVAYRVIEIGLAATLLALGIASARW